MQILVIAFYDTGIWLANCKPEIREVYHGLSDISITKLMGNEEDGFNIVMCDDVYFDTTTERDLTLKLLRVSRAYLEERTTRYLSNEYEEPYQKNPSSTSFDQAIIYLQRYFIGGGRMSFFLSNINESMSIPVAQKNIYYNIEVNTKIYFN